MVELSPRALRDAEGSEASFLQMLWGLSVPLRKSLLSPPLASKLLLHRYPDEGTKEPFRKEEEGNRERERPL